MNYDDILDSVKAPVRISFEPTITCNLRCPMCDRTQKSDFSKHRDEQLPYEVTKSFLHDVGRLGTRYFLYIGGGETLTDPHILGNLHDMSFEEIWRSKRAEELRELVKSGEYIDAPCVGCDTGHPIFTKDLIYSGSLDSYFQMSINAR